MTYEETYKQLIKDTPYTLKYDEISLSDYFMLVIIYELRGMYDLVDSIDDNVR